jgi:hypothetical protein
MVFYLLGLAGAAVRSGFKALSAASAGQLSQQQVNDELRRFERVCSLFEATLEPP